MKKICHITSTDQGSIPRLLRESATALKMGLEPCIVSQGRSFQKDGIEFIGVASASGRLQRMLVTSRQLVAEGLNLDADIYQLHDPELLRFALKLKRRGKKVIFDSHEFYSRQIEVKEYLPKPLRKIVAAVYRAYEGFICKRIDAVLAVCTLNGEDHFAGRSKETVVLANLPDSQIFADEGSGRQPKNNHVVYVGALSEARGITNLIRAAGKAEVPLTLCGPFDSQEYQASLEQMPEYRWVDYQGILTRDEVVQTLKSSAIGASTLLNVGQYSEIDTLPTKVYEYMALGLPVMITNTEYAKRILADHPFGIAVDPEDIAGMAETIRHLLQKPAMGQAMGEVGKRLVAERFNWGIEEKKLQALYTELLKDTN